MPPTRITKSSISEDPRVRGDGNRREVILLGATETFGQLLNRFDDKKDELKIRGDLSRLADEKERALAELGRMVMIREGGSPETSPYREGIAAVQAVEERERAKQDELQRLLNANAAPQAQPGGGAPRVTCPSCGTVVAVSAVCCPSCGDTLAEPKSQYKQCATCGTYYPADHRFCINDGSELVELTVVQPADPAPAPEARACPSCGASVGAGDRFCGSCGTPLA